LINVLVMVTTNRVFINYDEHTHRINRAYINHDEHTERINTSDCSMSAARKSHRTDDEQAHENYFEQYER
jgi:hypothetical protein